METARARIFFALALICATACSDNNGLPAVGDGGASAGRDAAWPGTCDPVLQNCAAGQQCVEGCHASGVMTKVFTCAVRRPDALATNGQDCGVGCAAGHDCYMVPNGDGGLRSVCRKYCNSNADCPNNRCVNEGLVCTPGDPAPIGRFCAL
jgi:hypothetical protein